MDHTITARGLVHHVVIPKAFPSAVRPVQAAKLRVVAVLDVRKAQSNLQSHVEQKKTYLG